MGSTSLHQIQQLPVRSLAKLQLSNTLCDRKHKIDITLCSAIISRVFAKCFCNESPYGEKREHMASKQGDLALLNEPLAQELLQAAVPARLAYVWHDGTPRVVPIWFHWTGEEFVLCSPPNAPKMKVLAQDTPVALTIDYEAWPARALTIRGKARHESVEGEVAEYPAMTRRYLGEEDSKAWRAQYSQMFPRPIRITIRPEWVSLIDVQTRLPSAIETAIEAMKK